MRIVLTTLVVFASSFTVCSCDNERNSTPTSYTPVSTSQLHTRERNTVAFLDEKMPKSKDEPLDWTKLPAELQYLAKPAEKYGRYQFDDKIDDFLFNKMTSNEKLELVALSKLFERDQLLIQQWLGKNKITVHHEARLVYFTMCLVGTACDSGLLRKEKD